MKTKDEKNLFNFQLPTIVYISHNLTYTRHGKNLFNFQLPIIVYISHNLTYTGHGDTQTPPPPLPIANETMHQTHYFLPIQKGMAYFFGKGGCTFLKTLVFIFSKNLSLVYKYNSLGLSYNSSFRKMQFQGLDSSSIFFGLDTSRPNLEP